MLLFFIIILLQALVTFFIKDYIVDFDVYSFILIFIDFTIASIYLFKRMKNEWLLLIYLGFVARVAIMLIDIYVPSIPIIGSGTDTEYFHHASVSIANGTMQLSEGRTFYVNVLSGLYYLFGEQRVLAQFMNIILWLFSAIYLYKAFLHIEVNKQVTWLALFIFTFLPNGMFMSSVLLRESIIVFMITLSVYHFFKWLKFKGIKNYFLALAFTLIGMLFHAGVVGLLIGYLFAFVFNSNQGKRSKKNRKILSFLLIVIVFILLSLNDDLFLSKFNSIQAGGVESLSISNNGGSAYLQGFAHYSGWQVFLLTPLKMLYFLFSPLPTDWRGLGDVISFLFDASVYLFLFVAIAIGFVKSNLDKKVKIIIGILLVLSIFIYAYGTGNAGTAIRHRYKLIPLILIAYGLLSKRKKVSKNGGIT